MLNSNDNSLTSALRQNWLLAGLTALSVAIPYADRLLPALAQQPSAESTPAIAQPLSPACKEVPGSHPFMRTDLFFGLGKPNGAEVTEAEFQQFLAREVTPQFPDGLTLLSGRGQFKDASGHVVKEPTRVVIVIYPLERSTQHNQHLEQIRNAYKNAFQQGSVLRTDEVTCVSF
jgi:hypothetical protein